MNFPQKRTFEKWLRSLPADTCIAERWGSTDCPLCAFLKDEGHATAPYISPSIKKDGSDPAIWRDDAKPTDPLPLPKWANQFSRGIDSLARVKPMGPPFGDDNAHFFRAVTPGDCLAVLCDLGGSTQPEVSVPRLPPF
jgi:hypothetical protein